MVYIMFNQHFSTLLTLMLTGVCDHTQAVGRWRSGATPWPGDSTNWSSSPQPSGDSVLTDPL